MNRADWIAVGVGAALLGAVFLLGRSSPAPAPEVTGSSAPPAPEGLAHKGPVQIDFRSGPAVSSSSSSPAATVSRILRARVMT